MFPWRSCKWISTILEISSSNLNESPVMAPLDENSME